MGNGGAGVGRIDNKDPSRGGDSVHNDGVALRNHYVVDRAAQLEGWIDAMYLYVIANRGVNLSCVWTR